MRRTVATLAVGALLGASGCGSTDSSSSDASAAHGTTDLAFTAETLSGATFDGTTLEGKPAVLWFWAPWCPTCRAQAPAVSTLAQEYDDSVAVVGVGGLADAVDIRDFAEQVDGPTHLVDEAGEVWRHFGVTAQSTYLVLDADGGVVTEGYLDDPVLAETVAGLVD